jgi:hypothetical protein
MIGGRWMLGQCKLLALRKWWLGWVPAWSRPRASLANGAGMTQVGAVLATLIAVKAA